METKKEKSMPWQEQASSRLTPEPTGSQLYPSTKWNESARGPFQVKPNQGKNMKIKSSALDIEKVMK